MLRGHSEQGKPHEAITRLARINKQAGDNTGVLYTTGNDILVEFAFKASWELERGKILFLFGVSAVSAILSYGN